MALLKVADTAVPALRLEAPSAGPSESTAGGSELSAITTCAVAMVIVPDAPSTLTTSESVPGPLETIQRTETSPFASVTCHSGVSQLSRMGNRPLTPSKRSTAPTCGCPLPSVARKRSGEASQEFASPL